MECAAGLALNGLDVTVVFPEDRWACPCVLARPQAPTPLSTHASTDRAPLPTHGQHRLARAL